MEKLSKMIRLTSDYYRIVMNSIKKTQKLKNVEIVSIFKDIRKKHLENYKEITFRISIPNSINTTKRT